MAITIENVDLAVDREPLIRPFGFKGGYYTEKWLCRVNLTSSTGKQARSLGGLSVLWSDSSVFAAHTEVGGNLIMAAMLEYALQLARGMSFESPLELLDALAPNVHAYGVKITGNKNLTKTFTLNALVALDNAAWVLMAAETNVTSFDEIIPQEFKIALGSRHKFLACVPLISYMVPLEEIISLVKQGHFFLKIKIGAPGGPETMLAKDKQRLKSIHQAVGDFKTPHTHDGKIRYYLDANGRYGTPDLLRGLIKYLQNLEMLDQVAILEEPFPPESNQRVDDFTIPVAADESLHNPSDVAKKKSLGYRCIALKPAGKTLSVSLRMAAEAIRNNMCCFVADSTCVPLLVDWNKNVAARLAPFPGLDCGILESNGQQSYVNWKKLLAQHPCKGSKWLRPVNGIFSLPKAFYKSSCPGIRRYGKDC